MLLHKSHKVSVALSKVPVYSAILATTVHMATDLRKARSPIATALRLAGLWFICQTGQVKLAINLDLLGADKRLPASFASLIP